MRILETIDITVESKSYPIYIGRDLFQHILELIPSSDRYTQFIVISDENVYALYGNKLEVELYQTGKQVETIVVPSGDESKSLEIYDSIIETMLEAEITRKALILALGGGMIGDLAGFVAGTYFRGIDFVQLPTTLLAHDSAIGGKVAINHPLAKNSIGVFYQPQAVIFNLDTFSTLPDIEWISGFGEVIKHSDISDVFSADNVKSLEAVKDADVYIGESLKVKKRVVEEDPFELGIRRNLNYGHTFGHALEQFATYQIPHGVCVLYGLIFVSILEKRDSTKYIDILKLGKAEKVSQFILPLTVEDFDILFKYMKRDKKQEAGVFSFLIKEADTLKMQSFDIDTVKAAYIHFLELVG